METQVVSIKKNIYEDWILHKHYAKRLCSVSYAFGLYINKVIEGVITFGMPPSSTLAESICGKEYAQYVLELNRLIINDNLPKNTLSQFVSKSINLLKKPKIIVSFADPNMNHSGYIYQATNFLYTGQSSNVFQYIDKDGKEFHFRNIGHYQKNNKLNVSLIKRRKNEDLIDKIQIANYLRNFKGAYTTKQIDKIFNYKDTSSHWFRLDSGFSFPKIDDWIKLKEILKFDDKFDKIMTDYDFIPDSNEIVKKLQLKKQEIKGKHRYVYFSSNKKDKKMFLKNFKLNIFTYPKDKNTNYDTSKNIKSQMLLI
tara:strand:- start:40 stop:972 length:933 start_codon:yes stop_codon:yes gene_type:complete